MNGNRPWLVDNSESQQHQFENVSGGLDGIERLLRLVQLAEELGAQRIADEACELAARVSEGRFYVACVGQFKRGKSTLINALIGHPILPTGFIPVTAVPTVVRFGDRTKARIRTGEGDWKDISISDLKQYVAEELNPENQKGIQGAEVFVSSRLLSSGMCLVDTPGLGSVFTGNTAATHEFIPHIDAALVVIGADPPLAGEELTLVETIGEKVQELILVLNKADRTTDAERDAASKFTRDLLRSKLGREVGPVLEVSAQERVGNRGPQRDWAKLIQVLQSLVDDSGRQLVWAACERGLERLSEQAQSIISEQRDALRRPIEESERRISVMKNTVAETERSMRELSFIFMAEQQRLSDLFVDRHKAFVASVLPIANKQFEDIRRSIRRGFGPSYRRDIMKAVQQIARDNVMPWLKSEQEDAEKEYGVASVRFVEIGNDFLRKLASADIPELARMPHALNPEAGFRVRSQFTFMDFIELAQPASPLRWLADVILPFVGARKLIENDAREFLVRLIETNSTRVQSDILNRVQEGRGRLEVEIRKLLHEVSRIAEEALLRARKVREEGKPAVDAELQHLDSMETELMAIQQAS